MPECSASAALQATKAALVGRAWPGTEKREMEWLRVEMERQLSGGKWMKRLWVRHGWTVDWGLRVEAKRWRRQC